MHLMTAVHANDDFSACAQMLSIRALRAESVLLQMLVWTHHACGCSAYHCAYIGGKAWYCARMGVAASQDCATTLY